jgi:flagellar basal body rod protein FlgG
MTSSAAALRYWERRQEVASNNLANVSTEGFKGQRVFARMVEGALPAADATTDFTPGTVRSTGNPYDVALTDRNFLVVKTPTGERLSRGGTLQVDAQGYLTDAAGNQLLGDAGPIRVNTRGLSATPTLEITKSGIVRADHADVGQLRIETIPPNSSPQREGSGLFVPPATRERVSPDTLPVQQGALEDSNVNAISEMVDMISIQRAYAAVQKAMTTIDAARGIATTELGRPV